MHRPALVHAPLLRTSVLRIPVFRTPLLRIAAVLTTAAALLAPTATPAHAQDSARFTRADTLRGSNGPGRSWWDVEFYDLRVAVNPADSTIRGSSGITYRVLRPAREMQVDLMVPFEVDSIVQDGRRLTHRRDGNALFVALAAPQRAGDRRTVTVHYRGRPRAARNAPWDGGFVWTTDSLGAPWVATAVQGYGASGWWPTKDIQADEPDSQRVAIRVVDPMVNVSNGRLRSVTPHGDGTTTWEWFVTNPINNYDVAVNAGSYVHFSDMYQGERGPLTLDYWPLAYHREAAEHQFRQVKPMLACFERWFGPYPWYEDGFKLVETPHLGMEHQSAVAYGNRYRNGYLGRDRSGSGYGLEFDFIIIHEAAHEWWGNNITSQDIADMWVHESFTNYAEGLYVECRFGKDAGAAYQVGNRRNVRNASPIVGPYGVNAEGSGDMYDKGGNMLHTIRQLVGDDDKWRSILRGLNAAFRHRTVTGQQVQEYMIRETGLDLAPVFAQYLTRANLPVLEVRLDGSTLEYRWADVVAGFAMPVPVRVAGDEWVTLRPTTEWQRAAQPVRDASALKVDDDFYVTLRRL